MSSAKIIGQPVVSLEYFPPKGLSAERSLMTGAHALRRFAPAYQTVTFGAGGSETDGSFNWSVRLQGLNEIPTAAHIALCHFSREELIKFAEDLWEQGIQRLVVLRGDAGGDTSDDLAGFASVAEAISALKQLYPFDISVASYPEVHPLAASPEADMRNLITKQDAGADRTITQYFFDNEDFYRFRDAAEKQGFRREIVPGVIPIASFERIKIFSQKCGARIPEHFHTLFAEAGDDKAAQSAVSRRLIEEQVRDLAQNGVSSLHIYTLNRVDLTADAIRAFQGEFDQDLEAFRPALVG
ncbi:MAG: methylenetetrahydrofolate reductase [Rhizobiaceae bacterium]|nr:methylenetetrahydrofolate reductase [Hyphomicrobiales bacterium]NRB30426.1 methylenetetrahydrofolate reductase [Rhizobiaceae bacterium]